MGLLRGYLRRLIFGGLLIAVLLVPRIESSAFQFPAVSHPWSLMPFAALMVVPFLDVAALSRRPLRWAGVIDLLLLSATVLPLSLEGPPRQWPVMLIYPLLVALAVRMLVIARVGVQDAPAAEQDGPTLMLPRSWLLAGIAVLALVHTGWALGAHTTTDIADGSVHGALRLIHGEPLYGAPARGGAPDPHIDTYGPLNYEAYLPFALLATHGAAARLTTLLFDLLSALLLFVLGRRLRGSTTGVVLAYAWLAFPLSLYEDALGLNDSIVAAGVLAAVLAAGSPARRGVAGALAVWGKLSPLVLIPLLAGDRTEGSSPRRGSVLRFSAGFGLASAVIFAPVLAHTSLQEFLGRTIGFQDSRAPSESLWSALQITYAAQLPWLATVAEITHGLLVAATGGLALAMFRIPRRLDTIGLAAAAASLLIAVQLCVSYYAYSYVLWFAPLALIAVLGGHSCRAAQPAAYDRGSRREVTAGHEDPGSGPRAVRRAARRSRGRPRRAWAR